MDLYSIYNMLKDNGGAISMWIFVGLTICQIAPIKINPWSYILSWIGQKVNVVMMDSITALNDKVDAQAIEIKKLATEISDNNAMNSRYRIIRFGDEILMGTRHSRDHFDQILVDIDVYEAYCKSHPDFINNKGQNAMALIQETYQKCLHDKDFL